MAGRPPRVLLKLSGEALCAPGGRGFDVDVAAPLAREIAATAAAGVELAVVVGAGNLFRGAELRGSPVPRDSADRMGMLATLMNGVFLRDLLIGGGTPAVTLTGLRAPETAETFTRRRADRALASGQVVICAGGTGHPYFTTDTAAALRALEIGADRLLKATKVDGVYSADPATDPDATRYDEITFDACLRQNLRVLDQAAFALCRDNGLEIVVFDMRDPGAIARAARGDPIGTRVHSGPPSLKSPTREAGPRARFGPSLGDSTDALRAADGGLEEAKDLLRAKGMKDAAQKGGRMRSEGVIGVHVHHDKQMAAMVELRCETDFVATNETFAALADDLARHVATIEPVAASTPELLLQPYAPDASRGTVGDVLTDAASKSGFGETIQIARFERWSVA